MPTLEAKSLKEKRAVKRSVYPSLWTADEFLEWLRPGVHADLINGRLFMHSPVILNHARQLNTLDFLLRNYIEENGLGKLFRETIAVRFDGRDVFLPDLCYFTNAQAPLLPPGHVPFAPTLVVEALSPRTARRDTGIKFAAYERHGVQEYWTLAPIEGEHRFFAREENLLVEFAKGEERVDARTLPGFYVKRSWLNPMQTQPPKIWLHEVLGRS